MRLIWDHNHEGTFSMINTTQLPYFCRQAAQLCVTDLTALEGAPSRSVSKTGWEDSFVHYLQTPQQPTQPSRDFPFQDL